MKIDDQQLALHLLGRLISKEKEPTSKVLVELYQNDLIIIKKWKDKMGVNWKDFFRAIVFMSEQFVDDEETSKIVMRKMMNEK